MFFAGYLHNLYIKTSNATEACSALQLSIISVFSSEEINGQYKGCIKIEMPSESWSGSLAVMTFIGVSLPDEYSALERVSEDALTYMHMKKGIRFDDINYGTSIVLQNKLTTAESNHRLHQENAATCATHTRLSERRAGILEARYIDLSERIDYICLKFAGLLPIYHKKDLTGDGDDAYAGKRPPTDRKQNLALALTRLHHHKKDTCRLFAMCV